MQPQHVVSKWQVTCSYSTLRSRCSAEENKEYWTVVGQEYCNSEKLNGQCELLIQFQWTKTCKGKSQIRILEQALKGKGKNT